MQQAIESVEIDAPIKMVYNQWTQFEEFPQFMDGVKEVQQIDDTHLRWTAEIAGKEESWTAAITEQEPDRAIAWKSESGAENGGAVVFDDLGGRTRVTLKLYYEPQGAVEKVGDALGFVDRQVKKDLENFKTLIDQIDRESGAWREHVHGGEKGELSSESTSPGGPIGASSGAEFGTGSVPGSEPETLGVESANPQGLGGTIHQQPDGALPDSPLGMRDREAPGERRDA